MSVEYDPMRDHYIALGVGSMASHDEIKKAHRSLIRQLHPDRGGGAMPAAQVNIARDVLLNPVTRAEYDRARANGTSSISSRPSSPRHGRRSIVNAPRSRLVHPCQPTLLDGIRRARQNA